MVVVVLIMASTLWRPAAGQDSGALETRVSVLETTVADLEGSPAPAVETAVVATGVTIYGTFAVGDQERDSVITEGDFCYTAGGYSDIGPGTDVTIRDGAGNVIATGRLDVPVPFPDHNWACVFPFVIAGVPTTDFYTIEVGRRGDITFSAADLAKTDYHVDLTLGDPVYFFDYDFLTPTAIPTATTTPLASATPPPTSSPTATPRPTITAVRTVTESPPPLPTSAATPRPLATATMTPAHFEAPTPRPTITTIRTATATPPPVPTPRPTSTPQAHDLKGRLKVIGDSTNLDFRVVDGRETCVGVREYRSLRDGATITIVDGDGNVLGSGDVTSTRVERRREESRICVMSFVVTDLPESPIYRFQIEGLTVEARVALKQFQADGWQVTLTVGPPG